MSRRIKHYSHLMVTHSATDHQSAVDVLSLSSCCAPKSKREGEGTVKKYKGEGKRRVSNQKKDNPNADGHVTDAHPSKLRRKKIMIRERESKREREGGRAKILLGLIVWRS